MSQPRVSVILPTYNRVHLIGRSIESVLGQTYRDFELIVIDDGSVDETTQIVRCYEGRLRFLQQTHQGKSVALNTAINEAKGEWVAFLDSDDYWLPDKLARQMRALDELQGNGCGACFTDGRFMNNPAMSMSLFEFYGRKHHTLTGIVPNPVQTFAASSAGVSVVTLVCRTDLVRAAGGFDPELSFTEDYDFVFRLSLVTKFCFVNMQLVMIDRTAPKARHTGTSAVWDRPDFRLKCEQYRCEKWLRLVETQPRVVRRIICRRLRCIHSAWANWYLSKEEYGQARKQLFVAAKYHMTPAVFVKWCVAHLAPNLTRTMVLKRQPANPDLVF